MLYKYTWEGLIMKRDMRRGGLEEDGLYSWLMHLYGDLWVVLKYYWMISEIVYKRLKVTDRAVLDRTKQKYMMDPEYMNKYD